MINSTNANETNKTNFTMAKTSARSTTYYTKSNEWIVVLPEGKIVTKSGNYLEGMEDLRFLGAENGVSVPYECLDKNKPAYTGWSYEGVSVRHYNDIELPEFPIDKEICTVEASSYGPSHYVK